MNTYGLSFQALGDGTRRRVLELIGERARSVGELTKALPISQPAVSQHLAILRGARLVRVTKTGTRRVYALDPAGLIAVRSYIDRFWDEALAAFAAEASSEENP